MEEKIKKYIEKQKELCDAELRLVENYVDKKTKHLKNSIKIKKALLEDIENTI